MNAREILFRLVAGSEDVARAAAAIATGADWQSIAATAYRWKVLPELNSSLRALDVAVEETARATIRKPGRESFLRSSMVLARGADALAVLESAGIPAIAFKGFAAVAAAGGKRGTRTLQDVDIIVERDDLMAVLATLEANGYERGFPGEIADYVRFVQHSPGFSGNEALNLRSTDGGELDIHWRAGPRGSARFNARSVLSRATTVEFRGRRISIPHSADAALLTIHHSLRNNLTPDDIIRDLLDLEMWITMIHTNGETTSFVTAAGESAMKVPSLALIEILQRVRPAPALEHALAEMASSVSTRETAAAGKMVKLFDVQMRDGPLNADMLYLVRGRPLRSVVKGALGGWSSYRKQMAAFEVRKHGSAVPLPQRLTTLLRCLVRSRARDWGALLELSKAKMQ